MPSREYYHAHKERLCLQNRQYYQVNRARILAKKKENRDIAKLDREHDREYDYEAYLEAQGHEC